jgi:hypothetical protein
MPRDGAIIFRDLVGKLDVLNVECAKCGRRGRYHLHRLIERYVSSDQSNSFASLRAASPASNRK